MNIIGKICVQKCPFLPQFLKFRSLAASFATVHNHNTTDGSRDDLHSAGTNTKNDSVTESVEAVPCYIYSGNKDVLTVMTKHMVVYEDFLSESEEQSFIAELEPYMNRLRYEFSHWDDAIHGYRETEKSNWNSENNAILKRVGKMAFSSQDKPLRHVHVLDISKEGYIKPHVDSVRFCGDTIAGLSLISSSVMRLVCEQDKEKVVDILLKQRSLYIMKGEARYKYTHEILPDNLSYFKNVHIPRNRRVSIICRNEPQIT